MDTAVVTDEAYLAYILFQKRLESYPLVITDIIVMVVAMNMEGR